MAVVTDFQRGIRGLPLVAARYFVLITTQQFYKAGLVPSMNITAQPPPFPRVRFLEMFGQMRGFIIVLRSYCIMSCVLKRIYYSISRDMYTLPCKITLFSTCTDLCSFTAGRWGVVFELFFLPVGGMLKHKFTKVASSRSFCKCISILFCGMVFTFFGLLKLFVSTGVLSFARTERPQRRRAALIVNAGLFKVSYASFNERTL